MSGTGRTLHRIHARGTPAHEQLLRDEAQAAGRAVMSPEELADFFLTPDPAWERAADRQRVEIDDRAEGRARGRVGYWDVDIEDRHTAPDPYPDGGLI